AGTRMGGSSRVGTAACSSSWRIDLPVAPSCSIASPTEGPTLGISLSRFCSMSSASGSRRSRIERAAARYVTARKTFSPLSSRRSAISSRTCATASLSRWRASRGTARCYVEGLRALPLVAERGERRLGVRHDAERLLVVALRERDAGEDRLRDRPHVRVVDGVSALEAALRRAARSLDLALLDMDRRERLQDGQLEGRVTQTREQLERARVVVDRAVELAGVVQRDRDAHVALRRRAALR